MNEEFCSKRTTLRLALAAGDDAAQEETCLPLTRAQTLFLEQLRALTAVLEKSPLGRSVLRHAVKCDVTVGIDPLLEPQGCFFYPAQNRIDLGHQPRAVQATEKGMSRYLASFICGLRRVWHLHQGAEPDTRLMPAAFMRQSRFAQADAAAVAHLVAWELRSAGAAFFWRYLLSGQDGDISVMFERAVLESPYHQFDGVALRAAFNQWFADAERLAACDHAALEAMDRAVLGFLELPAAQRKMRAMPGRKHLPRQTAHAIGQLPNGANYLSECPFDSAWYGRMEDDINRMHLLHVKRDITQAIDNNNYISGAPL